MHCLIVDCIVSAGKDFLGMGKAEAIFANLPDFRVSGAGADGKLPVMPVNLSLYFRDADQHRSQDRVFCHDSYILIYVFSGTRTQRVEGSTFVMKKNDLLIIPPYAQHSVCDNDAEFKSVMASFKISGDDSRLQRVALNCIKLKAAERKSLVDACKAFSRWDNGERSAGNEVLCLFALLLNQVCRREIPSFLIERKTPEDELVSKVVEYLTANRDHHVTLSELSRALFRSGSIIRQTFRRKVGMSLGHYELVERLRIGCQLLAVTDLSVAEIAERCGFNSTKGFSFAIKRECHHAPAELRKRNRGK